jgi:hypothetical protein
VPKRTAKTGKHPTSPGTPKGNQKGDSLQATEVADPEYIDAVALMRTLENARRAYQVKFKDLPFMIASIANSLASLESEAISDKVDEQLSHTHKLTMPTPSNDEVGQRQRIDPKSELWMAVMEAEHVPESERETLLAKFHVEIARATRPKWRERRVKGGELAIVSAPTFLKRVHSEEIGCDGSVRNDVIRAIDPDLMKAVELYISQRRGRGLDLGDAVGLNFVLSRPSRALPIKNRSRSRAKNRVPN